ncbi:MAG TPA: anti-sigma factor [Ilumatobacteraceae bacterium]|nr:anti-sigma factor [Ilumatobacteraceae bacterium]
MPDNCRHWQGLLAEHILASHGRAAPGDAEMGVDLAEHLADCADCRAAAEEFRSTAVALSGTTAPGPDPQPVPTSADLSMRITARVDSERRRRDRRRHRILGAAAAALLVIGGSAAVIAARHNDSPAGISEQVALSSADVRGDATLQSQEWGTEIHLAVTGVTPGQRYNVWLERADGSRVGAGTFIGIRNKPITVVLSSALAAGEAVAIGISEPDGNLVVRTPLD